MPFDIDTDYPRYVDGKVCEFFSDTIRVFQLNGQARDGAIDKKGPVNGCERHHVPNYMQLQKC